MKLLPGSSGWTSRRRGRNHRRRRGAALVAAGLLAVAGCAVDLGTLGGSSSVAADINERGVTVGWSTTADGSTHAFRKWPGRPMRDLNGSFIRSEAIAVNDAARVVGHGWVTEAESHVVVWDRRGRPHDLGPGTAADINDDGLVVGTRDGAPVVWDTASGEVEQLPDPPDPEGRLFQVQATAINDHGAIVGEAWFDFDVVRQGVLWEAGTREPVLLPQAKPRGPFGRLWSVPSDINDRGTIVGWSNSGTYFAIVWEAGTHEPVDITPPGTDSAFALGINNRGQVVGFAGAEWAFRWDPRTERAVDLGGLGGSSAQAWKINDAGVAAGWASTTDVPPPGEPLVTRAVVFPGIPRHP